MHTRSLGNVGLDVSAIGLVPRPSGLAAWRSPAWVPRQTGERRISLLCAAITHGNPRRLVAVGERRPSRRGVRSVRDRTQERARAHPRGRRVSLRRLRSATHRPRRTLTQQGDSD